MNIYLHITEPVFVTKTVFYAILFLVQGCKTFKWSNNATHWLGVSYFQESSWMKPKKNLKLKLSNVLYNARHMFLETCCEKLSFAFYQTCCKLQQRVVQDRSISLDVQHFAASCNNRSNASNTFSSDFKLVMEYYCATLKLQWHFLSMFYCFICFCLFSDS